MVFCAVGCDNNAKGTFADLGMILSRYIPPGKQQLIEKAANSGDLIIYPTDPNQLKKQITVVYIVIKIVAKDSATDYICRMAALTKETWA